MCAVPAKIFFYDMLNFKTSLTIQHNIFPLRKIAIPFSGSWFFLGFLVFVLAILRHSQVECEL